MSRLFRQLKFSMNLLKDHSPWYQRLQLWWDDVWYEKFLSFIKYYQIKNFINNLKWMVPAAWKFRPWDSYYNIELFSKSLEITGTSISKYGMSTVSEKCGRRSIAAGKQLLSAYTKDIFDDKSFNYLWHRCPLKIEHQRLIREYNNKDPAYIDKLLKVAEQRALAQLAKNKKEAWDYIHRYIEHFWD